MQQHIRALRASKEGSSKATPESGPDNLIALPVPFLKAMLEAASVPHTQCVTREDLSALVTAHEASVLKEMKAALRLAAASTKSCVSKGDVARLYMRRVHQCQGVAGAKVLKSVLGFDDELLTHLGEEEETVVPMELQDRRIH